MNDSQCCIVGAGPAGLLLALLLARKGIRVDLFELHDDLARDFRGDTVHASTLEILDQLGLADRVLQLPHHKMRKLSLHLPDETVDVVSFERLRTRFPYVAMMPQEQFLQCLLEEVERFENFTMHFGCPVTGLLHDGDAVAGVSFKEGNSTGECRAALVVAADGRFSKLRKLSHSLVVDQSPPMDIAWLRLPRVASDPVSEGGFYVAGGRLCVTLGREHEWQIGYVMTKGNFSEIRAAGITALQQELAQLVPWLADRVHLLDDFAGVHLLAVKADMLERWFAPGLLLIGDAAHAMSPVGGVGINYAIADAVEAANVMIPALSAGTPSAADLAQVQARRKKVTARMQRIQAMMQKVMVQQALQQGPFQLPWLARLMLATPLLRDIPARVIAKGIRPVRLDQV